MITESDYAISSGNSCRRQGIFHIDAIEGLRGQPLTPILGTKSLNPDPFKEYYVSSWGDDPLIVAEYGFNDKNLHIHDIYKRAGVDFDCERLSEFIDFLERTSIENNKEGLSLQVPRSNNNQYVQECLLEKGFVSTSRNKSGWDLHRINTLELEVESVGPIKDDDLFEAYLRSLNPSASYL